MQIVSDAATARRNFPSDLPGQGSKELQGIDLGNKSRTINLQQISSTTNIHGGRTMWGSTNHKMVMPEPEAALPGRSISMPVPGTHYVNGNAMEPPYPAGYEIAMFGMGCFWGAERLYWKAPGVHVTAVGYAGGYTPNPDYGEVCSGQTGHNEVVRVIFDPARTSFQAMLKIFWEAHNPTQGMRQGNDVGTQYRSGIYCYSEAQRAAAKESQERYQGALLKDGYEAITTEIVDAPEFYFAEPDHQQYLAKNPAGYCGLGGTGVTCQLEQA
jgi:peptide-methionine (S)-S-oxide reductase